MRNWMHMVLVLLFAFLMVPAAYAADAATCLGCHEAMEGSTKVEAERYSTSVHGAFDCTTCHMRLKGDQHQGLSSGAVDAATASLAKSLSAKNMKDAVAQASCVNCHPDAYDTYKASVHGRNVIVKKSADGPVCTSCHGSPHVIQPKTSPESAVNHFNVVKSCGHCHEEKFMAEKYGFSPLVMERYTESFHGRKLKVGHPGAPSCASCHGSHDVVSAKDPASPVSAGNKKKTCSKCHAGATDKFVAAITHQPLHPIAHWTEIALIILTMSVFIFICAHVVLDIFAEVRDRLFRKGGSHE